MIWLMLTGRDRKTCMVYDMVPAMDLYYEYIQHFVTAG